MIDQFKLLNGDEIIVEIIEEDDDGVWMAVKNSMKIVAVDDHSRGVRYYTFRPWMVYQDKPEFEQVLFMKNIVGAAKPNPLLVEQYLLAVKNEIKKYDKDEDEDDYLSSLIDDDDDDDYDDDDDNVISFKKDKLH